MFSLYELTVVSLLPMELKGGGGCHLYHIEKQLILESFLAIGMSSMHCYYPFLAA